MNDFFNFKYNRTHYCSFIIYFYTTIRFDISLKPLYISQFRSIVNQFSKHPVCKLGLLQRCLHSWKD